MLEAAIVPVFADRLHSLVADRFTESVITRWSRHRAKRFFEKFAEAIGAELASGQDDPKVNDLLDRMLSDDVRTEAMFDAYRRVSLSASRDIGPRIIGLLAGELVIEGRRANPAEDALFMAAETMNDREFQEFLEFFDEWRERADAPESDVRRTEFGLEIDWLKENIDRSLRPAFEIQTGPLNLPESLGTWAVRLKNLGLLLETITEKSVEHYADAECVDPESKTVRTLTWQIVLPLGCERFATLVKRAMS